nr:MAG TPA: hypothetical protein [Caudoviricetes sp.]
MMVAVICKHKVYARPGSGLGKRCTLFYCIFKHIAKSNK